MVICHNLSKYLSRENTIFAEYYREKRLEVVVLTQAELLNLFVNSTGDDWECFNSPSFISDVESYDSYLPNSGNERKIEARGHNNRASYKHDLAIGVAWGLTINDNFKEDWANIHPDPKASSHYLDFFYNGMLVFRTIYVVIDGGRSYMPLPKRQDNPDGTVSWVINNKTYEFFRIFNDLQGFDTQYSSYLSRSKIQIL